MRIVVLLLALGFLLGATSDGAAKERPRPSAPNTNELGDIVPGVLFIKFRDVTTLAPGSTVTGIAAVDRVLDRALAASIQPLHRTLALRKSFASREESSIARIFMVRYSAPLDPRRLAKQLAAEPSIEYAEPYYAFRPLHTPDDPRLAQQWAITVMKMEQAWDITKGDSSIVIGYVDSGINYGHEDLSLSIAVNTGEWGTNGELKDNGIDDDNNGYVDDWRGWDFIGNGTIQEPNPDNDPLDFNGHGTNGAGIAAATTNNGTGIAGIGYYTKLLPIKVQDDAGQGGMAGYDGLVYAADMGCQVINCSWGGNQVINQTLQDVVDYAWSKGCVIVGGAGNSAINNDIDPFLPAALNHVIGVSSIEQDGSFSAWAAYGSSVDVCAPGSNVQTTRGSFGYQNATGTSFSAPHISGLAALILAVHPDWTPEQVAAQIRVTSDAFGASRDALRYGRVNAFRALSENQTLSEIPGVILQSAAISTPVGGYFSVGGQTATVDLTLQNVLAPTQNAQAELVLTGSPLTAATTTFAVGAIPTSGTTNLSFQVTLDNDIRQSEGYVPVIVKITDGAYEDYLLVRIPVYLDNAWHTVVDLRYPYNSIDIADRWNIWVSGDYTENSVPVQDIALRSTDGGDTWSFAFGTGFPSGRGVYCIDAIDGNTALVGTGPVDGNAAICRSSDAGQNWTATSVANLTAFVNWIHMFDAQNGIMQGDPRNNVWGIATTVDGGQTWTPLAAPLTAPAGEAGWNNAYDVVGDNIWFGTNSSKIYKSTDRGQTWTGYATPSKNSVDVNFRDALVGVARFSKQGEQGTDTLAITTDGGSTWSLVSTVAVPSGSVVFERNGARLWFFQESNALVSTDLGATWSVQPAPADFDFINDAAEWNDGFVTSVFAAGIEIYRYNGDFVLDVDGGPSSVPPAPILHALYPNPASNRGDGTIASLTLPAATPVVLAVYDLTGRKLREVFNATLDAGTHRARVSTAGLPAGSYLLRLTTPSRTSSQTLIVLN
ncbi:MAG: S8 family serine peptidase [Bacteroidota bacterium]|jgi:subtilisin family serine protease|nr:S8 family serine peptidase [Bacteroidota bacterium]